MNGRGRGFSLVELLIVIAIVSIVASIAVPGYSVHVRKSQVTNALVMLQKAKKDVAENHLLTGRWPSNMTYFYENTAADAEIASINWYSNVGINRLSANFGPGSPLVGKRLWFAVEDRGGILVWTCMNSPMSWSKIPEEALPSECA